MPCGLEARDVVRLAIREDGGHDLIDPELGGDAAGDGLIVPRQEDETLALLA